jgi:hypothetical protein
LSSEDSQREGADVGQELRHSPSPRTGHQRVRASCAAFTEFLEVTKDLAVARQRLEELRSGK